MNTYVFDQGWQKEHDRLAGIESLYDSYSTHRLAGLGVREGWDCLEVGFGAGQALRGVAVVQGLDSGQPVVLLLPALVKDVGVHARPPL